jgi:hypothetical protein
LVCGETESIADLLHRLNATLGKAAAENIVIDEVLPEIKRPPVKMRARQGAIPTRLPLLLESRVRKHSALPPDICRISQTRLGCG